MPTVWDLFSIKGKAALVIGGAKNLGKDMAEALAEAGADVAITSRSLADAEKTASTISGTTGKTVRAYELDNMNEKEIISVMTKVNEDFGAIDILVNNAGNIINSAVLEDRAKEDWEYTFATNTTGTFLCVREAVKFMEPRRAGVIINIASVSGMIGKDRSVYEGTDMIGVTIDYSAAKAAVINMTRDMACYLAPKGIRVNCISTAGFERGQPESFLVKYKKQIPLGRLGEDGKDMKGAVVYLASEASAFMTGHNLVLDGGNTAW